MGEYEQWIAERSAAAVRQGIAVDKSELHPEIFPHQADLVVWALARASAAVFADTGLGKTLIQLEWSRVISDRVGPVLILAPLAVADQTVREADRFGIDAVYARQQSDAGPAVTVTNYEMLDKFDPCKFSGIVLDESSILKSYTGAFRNMIIESFVDTPYKLACTATPAPNDHTELGNHSEFLGIKSRLEMLAEYFVHDGGSTQNWRLKGHADDAFWLWVSSWARMVKKPSDLGYPNEGYDLPPMTVEDIIVPVDHDDAREVGLLFMPQAETLNDQRATRRATVAKRVNAIVNFDRRHPDEPLLVWCELNSEADAVTEAIPGAVQVAGSDDREAKRDRLLGFATGTYRVLVTKPKIAGHGMNWQHCNRIVFAGASHSYEQTYQAIRRCWRFGQTRPVNVAIVRAETEQSIASNFRRKEADAERMADKMLMHMRAAARSAAGREWNTYTPTRKMMIPEWVGKDGLA